MVLDLCLCSISLIDEIIQHEICVVIFDPMIITIYDLALCCVVSKRFSSWFFMANGSKEVVFRRRFNIIKALIWDKSINWKVDFCISLCGLLLMYSWRLSIMINTSGWVWILVVTSDVSELLQFAQSLSSNCSIPKSQWIKSFKDIEDLSWGKLNIISIKFTFV